MVRKMFNLSAEVVALHELAQEEQRSRASRDTPELSQEEMKLHATYRACRGKDAVMAMWGELPLSLQMYIIREDRVALAQNPYSHSKLREWLSLETWQPKDALLLLSGVEPSGAMVEWSYENFVGVEIDSPRIKIANDLDSVDDHYLTPPPDAWNDDIEDVRRRMREGREALSVDEIADLNLEMERLEDLRNNEVVQKRAEQLKLRSKILATLSRVWFSGDHDAQRRYSPEHFLEWADARGYRPVWYDWAMEGKLIDLHDGVYRPPFFDPDSDDYPELLHIAVRAWEAVRQEEGGTPKQRLLRYLKEHYPKLSSNTCDLIAQIANWQRIGGRPKE